jgi:hypothetical protein
MESERSPRARCSPGVRSPTRCSRSNEPAALLRGNFELASYHWAKIKLTIENGTMKRPARRASADAFLLTDTWGSVNEALESGDRATAWRGFEKARASCMKCHEAERVGYMNDQPMFTDRAPIAVD